MFCHGNKIHYDGTLKKYRLTSTNEIIKDDLSNLICPKCGKPPVSDNETNLSPESEIYDACIGKLKGIKFACCGHGGVDIKYVMEDSGKCRYGDNVNFELYK